MMPPDPLPYILKHMSIPHPQPEHSPKPDSLRERLGMKPQWEKPYPHPCAWDFDIPAGAQVLGFNVKTHHHRDGQFTMDLMAEYKPPCDGRLENCVAPTFDEWVMGSCAGCENGGIAMSDEAIEDLIPRPRFILTHPPGAEITEEDIEACKRWATEGGMITLPEGFHVKRIDMNSSTPLHPAIEELTSQGWTRENRPPPFPENQEYSEWSGKTRPVYNPHWPECPFRRALDCTVHIECEHGLGLCAICDPCDCDARADICLNWGRDLVPISPLASVRLFFHDLGSWLLRLGEQREKGPLPWH